MEKDVSKKSRFDLEERTYLFAKKCRDFVRKLPKRGEYIEYGKQLVRSSGSVAANYIEANEALSKKDFAHRIKIARKESKESCLWIRLCDTDNEELELFRKSIFKEAEELRNILTAILGKVTS